MYQGLRMAVAEMESVSAQGRCQPSVVATATQTPAPGLMWRPCLAHVVHQEELRLDRALASGPMSPRCP